MTIIKQAWHKIPKIGRPKARSNDDGAQTHRPRQRWTRATTAIELAQLPAPALDYSVWQFFLEEPSFLVVNFVALAVIVTALWFVRRRYARFLKIQQESLDHRKIADAQVLAQNQSFEQLIARQHNATNAHNQ